MSLDIIVTEENVELDNGHQYIKLDIDEAKKVLKVLEDKLYAEKAKENLKKDYNYFGGL